MLLDRSDLGVDGLDTGAGVGSLPNLGGVPLEGTVDDGVGHARHVSGSLCVGEGAVSGGLLKTFHIGNVAQTSSSSLKVSIFQSQAISTYRIAQQTEDRIPNVVWVVDSQRGTHDCDELFVRVLLRNLTAVHALRTHRGASSQCGQGQDRDQGLGLHGELLGSVSKKLNKYGQR